MKRENNSIRLKRIDMNSRENYSILFLRKLVSEELMKEMKDSICPTKMHQISDNRVDEIVKNGFDLSDSMKIFFMEEIERLKSELIAKKIQGHSMVLETIKKNIMDLENALRN